MSRTNNDNDQIWQVTTKMPTGQLQVYRSQKVGDASIRIDAEDEVVQVPVPGETDLKHKYTYQETGRQIQSGPWEILTQLLLDDARERIVNYGDNDKNLSGQSKSNIAALSAITPKFENTKLAKELLYLSLSFVLGDNSEDIYVPLRIVGNHGLLRRNPAFGIPKSPGVFPIVRFHADDLVQAVLDGDEKVVGRILRTNSDLSQIGTGMDFSGRQFTGTALQAAIACTDFAANENSTGLCELIVEALKRQHPDHWGPIFEDQAMALYTKSLRFYAEKQADKIRALSAKKDAGEMIDETVLETAKERHQAYLAAIHSKDLATIINAHTAQDENAPDAQKDHVLEVDQALIDAIAAASDAEVQTVFDDPTIDSPLSNLLKQFITDVTKLFDEEIIFNPQHLLKIFKLYNEFYNRLVLIDPNWKKRDLFWGRLVEFVACYLPSNVAQIFANPGLFNTVENKEKNQRLFDFKYGSGSFFPLSFTSDSLVDIKLRGDVWGAAEGGFLAVRGGGRWSRAVFSKLMSSKNSKLGKLMQPTKSHQPRRRFYCAMM